MKMVSQGVKLTEKQRVGFFGTETGRDCEVRDCEVLEKCAQTGIKGGKIPSQGAAKEMGKNLKSTQNVNF